MFWGRPKHVFEEIQIWYATTAMGTKATLGFANNFMRDFEEQFVNPYKLQPLKYFGFL